MLLGAARQRAIQSPQTRGIIAPTSRAALAVIAGQAITSTVGTTVTDKGNGFYTITKTAADGWGNAGALSAVLAGDFTLRLRPQSVIYDIMAGVSLDPTVNDSYNTVTHGWEFYYNQADYCLSGAAQGNVAPLTTQDFYWIGRRGSTLTFRRGYDWANATVVRTVGSVTGSWGFDSAFYTSGGVLDAYLINA